MTYVDIRAAGQLRGWAVLLLIGSLCSASLHAAEPRLLDAARREGKVVVYSVLSTRAAKPLIDDFQALYPGIEVAYDGDKGSNEMDARYRTETASGQETADIVWSSSTDMQMKLVADGFAADYESPEASALPEWAVYRNRAYATTLEPVVFAYNPSLISASEMPRDHAALIGLLHAQPERFRGRVTGFDVSKSGVGLMFAMQDRKRFRRYNELLDAFAQACFVPSAGTGDMLTGLSRGEFAFGYNIMGAYAISRSAKDLPNLAVVFPSDFTLMLTRIAFVSKTARHPNAARLWLDYILSARGQAVLGNALELYPIRSGVDARRTASALLRQIGAAARPIPVDMGTAHMLAKARGDTFAKEWMARVAGRSTTCRSR